MFVLLSKKSTATVMLRILVYILLCSTGMLIAQHRHEIKLKPSSFLEATEGESKTALCELPNADRIEWIAPNKEIITDNPKRLIYVSLSPNRSVLQLFLTNVTEANSGTYTCRATSSEVTDSKKFELKVLKRYQFEDDPKIYYAPLGSQANLQCKLNSNELRSAAGVSWSFNGQSIPNGRDSPFVTVDDGEKLVVKRVTDTTFGNYTCMYIVSDTGNVLLRDMQLKLATPPDMVPVHASNTVHVPISQSPESPYWARLTCKVTADPPAVITWLRYDKSIKPREYGVIFEEGDNQKTMKLPIYDRKLLGAYRCDAANSLGSANITIFVTEGVMPKVPIVHRREAFETGYRLDIDQEKPQNLSNFRVLYRKKGDSTQDWSSHDFHMRDSQTLPYSINGLESNTEYIFKVGACTEVDLCAFTDESVFKTTETVTNSANMLVQTFLAQFIILLPAFVINFYSQRH